MRGAIFLADALRVLHVLKPDTPEDVAAVLELLGTGPTAAALQPASPPPAPRQSAVDGRPVAEPEVPAPQAAAPPAAVTSVPSTVSEGLRALPAEPGRAVAALARTTPRREAPEPPFEPLLRPEWTRGVLFAAAATQVADGEVDLPRMVHLLAVRRPPARIPRRRRWSGRLGAQLLVDMGPGMAPYRADRTWLMRELADVIGRDGLSVLRFASNPLTAGPGPRSTWRRYAPPVSGLPVLVFSDATVFARQAPVGDWAQFAEDVATAGSPVVLITPVSAGSVPTGLRARAAVVELDSRTTMAKARLSVSRWRRR